MTLDRLATILADFARDMAAYAAADFRPRPFILGIAAGLIAPCAVRLLAWVL